MNSSPGGLVQQLLAAAGSPAPAEPSQCIKLSHAAEPLEFSIDDLSRCVRKRNFSSDCSRNASDTKGHDGKLYLAEWGKHTYVKRLYQNLDGMLRVDSDNPAAEYEDRVVAPSLKGFRIVGRIRWIGSWED